MTEPETFAETHGVIFIQPKKKKLKNAKGPSDIDGPGSESSESPVVARRRVLAKSSSHRPWYLQAASLSGAYEPVLLIESKEKRGKCLNK